MGRGQSLEGEVNFPCLVGDGTQTEGHGAPVLVSWNVIVTL